MTGFITLIAFAEIAGISRQAAHKVAKRTLSDAAYLYRGSRLIIRKAKGRGGKSGLSYEVAADSLPTAFQLDFRASQSALERPLKLDSEAIKERDWWSFHLASIAALPRHSVERGQAIESFAARPHLDWTGTTRTFSPRHVRRQLARMESGGSTALLPRKRRDTGQARVIVTRAFDAAALDAGITRQQLEDVKAKLTRYIRSLIANGAAPKMVAFNSEAKINALAESLGIAATGQAFKVPDHLIQAEGIYKKVDRYRRDRKAHEDAKPRIMRSIEGLQPMDLIICDVHVEDIVMTRPDGTTATARLIAWYDCATHRVFLTPVLCEAGTGIRNAHVIQSFMDMVAAWGLPKALYLDNGSEYNWADFTKDALKLASDMPIMDTVTRGEAGQLGRIIRAKAYNAAAKGAIEGFFRTFENSYLSHLPGYIGGNRLLKKSANVGRPPVPFQGGIAKLSNTIGTALRLYNALPQRGRLRNISPDEKFEQFVNSGWTMTAVDENALRIAFSEEKSRAVTRGRIQYDGQFWTCDELMKYQGSKVIALIPKYERWDRIPLRDEQGQPLGYASPEQSYGYLDPNGAIEAARRGKLALEGVKELERQTDKIDVQQETENNIVRLPAPVRAPVGATLSPSDMAQEIITRIDEPEHDRQRRKLREEDEKFDKWDKAQKRREEALRKFKS